MAMIICSECSKSISDKAGACPHCGNPIGRPTTIEATGKKWKKIQLYCGIAIFFGILILLGGAKSTGATSFAALILAGGVIGILYSRFGAWWHHG